MRIAAMLAWYNEPAAQLYKCVSTAAQLADTIIAAEGPYAQYPHHGQRSNSVQHQAVTDAAHDARATLVQTSRHEWEGQVAKRNHMMQQATRCAVEWVFPIDADETIHECDTDTVRAELDTTTHHVINVPRYTPPNGNATPNSQPGETAGGTQTYPRIFRTLPGIRVENWHWHYVADTPHGPLTLWGPRHIHPCADTIDIEARLLFHHHQLYRTPEQRAANTEYRRAVDASVKTEGKER